MHTVSQPVAVIGAGPGGLVAARYLKQAGFRPVLFDPADGVGGQWRVGSAASGVWPGMRTNTSRVTTAFSDLAHAPDTPVYPTGEQVGAYLERYADRFGLLAEARLRTRVAAVTRDPNGRGWLVRSTHADGAARVEQFSHVVVATGRHHRPSRPTVAGLDGFTGVGGVVHAGAYRGAAAYRGRRVVVAGNSISALEIAGELALQGAARVIVASRRQRYVLQKLLAGVPTDHVAFTRFAALAGETFPPAAVGAALRDFVVRTSGRPDQFGAPRPADDIVEAGLTQSQHYLPLVAEGRIAPRPWIDRVDGDTVHFHDGTSEPVDAIVLGTGYELELPFAGAEVHAALAPDGQHADLHAHTFHPELPGIAFVGLFEQVGPYLPVLELQARWVAYAWSGVRPAPTREAMWAGIAAARARRGTPAAVPMHVLARLFAREAGVEPDPTLFPALARALYFGPLSPASFRLVGPDACPDAAARVARDAAAFGAVPDGVPTAEQRAQLAALAGARGDAALAALVAALDRAATVAVDAAAGPPGNRAGRRRRGPRRGRITAR